MIDPNYIHQRDVTTILNNLQNDVNSVRERYAENPNDPQLAIELQKLIDNADRDLRLKTQAIVRARLSQSRLLPIQTKSIPAPELPPRSHSVACTGPPLPPLQPAPSDYESSNPRRRGIGNIVNQPPQPIPPMAHEKRPKVLAAPITKEKSGRTRRILPQKETLPRVDKHDPLAPPPPISEKLINEYGLEQLNETGLIQNSDIKKHLEGIVTVAPFTYELPPVPLSVSPNYVLDTSNQSNSEIFIKPNSREKPATPVEENDDQKNDKNDITSISSSKFTKSDDLDTKFDLINGIPDEDSPGYTNFIQLSFNISETIEIYMDLLRRFCEDRGIKFQQIDGRKLIELATIYDPDEISDDRLIKCFIGDLKKIKKGGRFGFGFVGFGAEKKAAVAIQSVWRGYIARRMVRFIKRNTSAAKKIQNWYKQKKDIYKFNQSLKKAKYERLKAFLKLQKSDFYHPEQPHLLLHIIDGHLPTELGRIQALQINKNATLAIFSRFPLPTIIASYLKDHVEDQEKLVFVVPRQKLPYKLPMEDVLASDLRLMKHIKEIADEKPIYLIPNRMRDSLIDAGSFMKSFVLSPLPKALEKVQGLTNNREFLSIGCKNLFITAQNEVFNKEDLCSYLADLSLSNLIVQQWIIRSNSGKFAWINTNDIAILAKLRQNAKILTQSDLDDPTFKNLLIKNFSDDLNVITNTISTINKNDFLNDVWSNGAIVQAAPQQIRSQPSVSLFVTTQMKKKSSKTSSRSKETNSNQDEKENKETQKSEANQNESKNEANSNQLSNDTNQFQDDKNQLENEENQAADINESEPNQLENEQTQNKENERTQNDKKVEIEEEEEEEFECDGEVHITGTWENLYISEFERFATIHPAFMVKPEKLRKHSMKYADEMVKRNLIGSTVIDFWASNHDDKDRLTPDSIEFTATERCLPQMLSENVCNLTFNEKLLKMKKYTYVQERLVLPYEMPTSEFNSKCIKNGIKLNKNVFFLPDLQEEITIGFVAVAETPELLINLVYETFCILSEKVFDLRNEPNALLFSYCTAIEFLKDQIDSEFGITSTVFMKKMKVKVVEDQVEPLLFHFDDLKNKKEVENEDESSFKEMHEIDDNKMADISSTGKSKQVKIFDNNNYVTEVRRSLLTTPVDADGRERKLITAEDEKIEDENDVSNNNNSGGNGKAVKEDLPDAPAGANIPEEPPESVTGQLQAEIEGTDDEILTEEAQSPRSDDDE